MKDAIGKEKITALLEMMEDCLGKAKIISDNLIFEVSHEEYNLEDSSSPRKTQLQKAIESIDKVRKAVDILNALLAKAKESLK